MEPEHDEGQEQGPESPPGGEQGGGEVEAMAGQAPVFPHGIAGQGRGDEQGRNDAGQVQIADGDGMLRRGDHHGIEDHGDAGRHQHAQGSARGQEPQGEFLRILILAQGRIQDGSHGDQGHRRGPGDGGEEDAGRDGDDGQPGGKPPEPGLGGSHQATGDGAIGHDLPRGDEEGDGQQHVLVHGVEHVRHHFDQESVPEEIHAGQGRPRRGR